MERQALFETLMRLPQAKHFSPENVQRFVEAIADDPRAFWHVERLSGIGGSEIGVIVADLLGERDAFGMTSADVVREKLLLVPPRKQTLAMRKGMIAEACIRQFFHEDYKAKSDKEVLDRFHLGEIKRPRDWMRYTPDDIVIINGRRYLCDYKYPQAVLLQEEVPLRYIAQLHQGRILLDYNDIPVDGMLLVHYPEKGDDLIVYEIEADDAIVDAIFRGGDAIWAKVLAGEAPKPEMQEEKTLDLPEAEAERLAALADEFVRCKTLAEALLDEAERHRKAMAEVIQRRIASPDTRLKFGALKVYASGRFNEEAARAALGDAAKAALEPVYSAERMAQYLRAQGVDMSQFETGQTVCNRDRLLELLRAHGLSEAQFTTPSLRFNVFSSDAFKEAARAVAMSARERFQSIPVESKASRSRLKP